MITKITGEQPFQVLTNNFSISPSNEGYTLQISADGINYSNLFTVGAGVTRLVTGVAANSYYRLSGNQSQVSINWMKTCVTEGGEGGVGNELTPVSEFPVGAEAGTVVAYSGSSSAAGVYQYDGTDWNPAGGEVDLSAYWTSAETQSAISAATSGLATEQYVQDALSGITPSTEDIELPIAAAVNELRTSVDAKLSQQYYKKQEVNGMLAEKTTPGQVDTQIQTYVDPAIAGVNATIEDKELPISAALNEQNERLDDVEDVAASALVQLNDKVGSQTVDTIWTGTQAQYDAITTKDPATLYIIVNQ